MYVYVFTDTTHSLSSRQSAKGRQIWATTRDARKTYDALPTRAANERLVLKALMRAPDDYRGAFGLIPRTLRTLYLHRYTRSHSYSHITVLTPLHCDVYSVATSHFCST